MRIPNEQSGKGDSLKGDDVRRATHSKGRTT